MVVGQLEEGRADVDEDLAEDVGDEVAREGGGVGVGVVRGGGGGVEAQDVAEGEEEGAQGVERREGPGLMMVALVEVQGEGAEVADDEGYACPFVGCVDEEAAEDWEVSEPGVLGGRMELCSGCSRTWLAAHHYD